MANRAWLLLAMILSATHTNGRSVEKVMGGEKQITSAPLTPKYELPEDAPFMPFLMTDYNKWKFNHYHHYKYFPNANKNAMIYAFERKDVPDCMMISENGHIWVEHTPNITDPFERENEQNKMFLSQTIFCSWTPKDDTGLLMWFKNHNTPNKCPKVDKCPHGLEKVGKAHAAYYIPEYTHLLPRLDPAPEFGPPCTNNDAPDPTFLCLLRNRDPSCTYIWRNERHVRTGVLHIEYKPFAYETMIMMDATRVLRGSKSDVLFEKCKYNNLNNNDADCTKDPDYANIDSCRIFDYYSLHLKRCMVCPKTNPYFYND
jgi:hypothetical protein